MRSTIGRVKRGDGSLFPNLFAAGGAAAGVSGSTAAGYLSGNGLLTASVLGRWPGRPQPQSISGKSRTRSTSMSAGAPHAAAYAVDELGKLAGESGLQQIRDQITVGRALIDARNALVDMLAQI